LHQWETVKDTKANRYEQCTTCGERRASRYASGGYQPIDRQWVATGEWFSWHNLNPTAGSASPIPRNEQHTADPRLLGRDTQTRQAWDRDGKQYFERVHESPDNRPLWPDLYGEEAT